MGYKNEQTKLPMTLTPNLDLGLSSNEAPSRFSEKTHAAQPVKPVSRLELHAARIGFFTGGFTVASWAPIIPYIQSELSLDPLMLGLLLLCLSIGSFVGMPLAGTLTRKFGARNAIAASGLASCVLLVILASIPSFSLTCTALLAYGVALGCLEVGVNIYGTNLENRMDQRLMSGLHAAYSIGEVASAVLLTTMFIAGLSPITAVSAMMACLIVALIVILKDVRNEKIAPLPKPGKAGSSTRITGVVAILSVICAVVFLTEGSMLDWSAIYLRDFASVPQDASAIGYTLFVIAMAISRLAGDRLTTYFGAYEMLRIGVSVILASLLLLVLIPHPAVALFSLFLMGLGLANVAPILISAASRTSEMDSIRAIMIVSTAGYGGLLVGPAFIGAISKVFSLQGAFLCVSMLLAVVLGLIYRNKTSFR